MKPFRYLDLSCEDAMGTHLTSGLSCSMPSFHTPTLQVPGRGQGQLLPQHPTQHPQNLTLHLLDQMLLNVQEKREDQKKVT